MLRWWRMIMRLHGTVIDSGLDWMLVDVQGVGYRIGVALAFVSQVQEGQTVTVWTHEVMRDEVRHLFGFADRDTLELFWKLIAVNGVGPKVAQKILGASSPAEIRQQVTDGSVDFLTRIPGVGKKTAQKIILELRGSLVPEPEEVSADQEVLDALVSLGYALQEARAMAQGLPTDLVTMEQKIKAILSGQHVV